MTATPRDPANSAKAAQAYLALTEALQEQASGCDGDARFTLEAHQVHADELPLLVGICWACPVRQLCADYATAARPPVGFWAGRMRRRRDTVHNPDDENPDATRDEWAATVRPIGNDQVHEPHTRELELAEGTTA